MRLTFGLHHDAPPAIFPLSVYGETEGATRHPAPRALLLCRGLSRFRGPAAEGARLALPPPEKPIDWRTELGLAADCNDLDVAETVWKRKALRAGEGSPDLKGLNLAIAAARSELR